jgi:hypothetical protein
MRILLEKLIGITDRYAPSLKFDLNCEASDRYAPSLKFDLNCESTEQPVLILVKELIASLCFAPTTLLLF